MKYKSLLDSFSLFAVAALLGCLIGVGINRWTPDVQAQLENSDGRSKSVKLSYSRKPIIKISQLKVSEKTKNFGESFDEGENWLKNLSFKLENQSGKRIVYLQVNVNFPETRASGNMMSFPIVFGQFPDIVNYSKNPPFLLKPDDSIEVSLNKDYDELLRFINTRTHISSLRKVELEIGFIIFDDKTAWSAGSFSRQDPNNPGRYIDIEPNHPQ